MHLTGIHFLLHLLKIIITEFCQACSSTVISRAGFLFFRAMQVNNFTLALLPSEVLIVEPCYVTLGRSLYTTKSCTSASETMLAKQYKPTFSTLCCNSQLNYCVALKLHWRICIAEPKIKSTYCKCHDWTSLLLSHLNHFWSRLCFPFSET
jgi:hypothetical protein